jgi:phenylpropionate dioxygenase-like ring-hydroxylating dioxygenase large terminal subunit
MTLKLPYTSYPTGWFQIGWSDELSPGEVRPITYFDDEMVLVRSASGVPAVFGAFCPHMGAHLGYGGVVEGECVRCPYHGWAFDAQGNNTEIPYDKQPNKVQKLVTHHVVERNGMIYLWHSDVGQEPYWQPPQITEFDSPDFRTSPLLRKLHPTVRVQPQLMWENQTDAAHQQWVHKGSEPTKLYVFEADEEPHVFHTKGEIIIGAKQDKTWLSPEGSYWAELHTWTYGLGFAFARFVAQDDSVHGVAVTPIDHETCDLFSTVACKASDFDQETGEPGTMALKRFKFEVRQTERDIVIWEHQQYVERAPFSPFEARQMNALRRWSRQFYPDAKVPSGIEG